MTAAAAGENCGSGLVAMQAVFGYVRQRQLLGDVEDFELSSLGLSVPLAGAEQKVPDRLTFSVEFEEKTGDGTIAREASGPSFDTITDWEILGGEKFATGQWNRPGPIGSDVDSATLRHEPQ